MVPMARPFSDDDENDCGAVAVEEELHPASNSRANNEYSVFINSV